MHAYTPSVREPSFGNEGVAEDQCSFVTHYAEYRSVEGWCRPRDVSERSGLGVTEDTLTVRSTGPIFPLLPLVKCRSRSVSRLPSPVSRLPSPVSCLPPSVSRHRDDLDPVNKDVSVPVTPRGGLSSSETSSTSLSAGGTDLDPHVVSLYSVGCGVKREW